MPSLLFLHVDVSLWLSVAQCRHFKSELMTDLQFRDSIGAIKADLLVSMTEYLL